ncbi:Tfp pilus assembly protein FimT/FimU [Synechococcus sp. CC9616]|uniref:pilus assembly FimT family protein n=1 Tax=Synechococcus sp. CC9616 TaxID=110663 RepID=UPI00048BF116|nr:prepilin-type N-terminal cleavage/methylation domain-containing protein [Synechococcus sp. CC9616]
MQRHDTVKSSEGFSLLELIVAAVIISMTAVWATPEFRRGMAQAKVDRYTKNLEGGLFSIRAKMGAIKESCKIDFAASPKFKVNAFTHPINLLEVQEDNGTRRKTHALSGCIAQIDADDVNQELNSSAIRLVNLEGSRERDSVEVSASAATFAFTPPGTTANDNDVTILIRSVESEQPWATKNDGSSRLVTRCIEVTGNGQIFSGRWDANRCIEN